MELLNLANEELERVRSDFKSTETNSKIKLKQLQTLLFNSSSKIQAHEEQLILKEIELQDIQSRLKKSDECIDEATSMILTCLGMATSNFADIDKGCCSNFKCKGLIDLINVAVVKVRNLEVELHNKWTMLSKEQSSVNVMHFTICQENLNVNELKIKLMKSKDSTKKKEAEIKILKKKLISGRKQMNDMVLALNVMTEELNMAGKMPANFSSG